MSTHPVWQRIRTRLPAETKYAQVDRVVDDAAGFCLNYVDMEPMIVDYVFENGRDAKLLSLQGTIPVRMKSDGNEYHFPVHIYLLEAHPDNGPIVYVRPTNTMKVNLRHRHLDSNGRVYHPYLASWKYGSNLLQFGQIMQDIFSTDAPVHTVIQPQPPVLQAQSGYQAQYGYQYPGSASTNTTTTNTTPAYSQHQYQPQYQQSQMYQPQYQPQYSADPSPPYTASRDQPHHAYTDTVAPTASSTADQRRANASHNPQHYNSSLSDVSASDIHDYSKPSQSISDGVDVNNDGIGQPITKTPARENSEGIDPEVLRMSAASELDTRLTRVFKDNRTEALQRITKHLETTTKLQSSKGDVQHKMQSLDQESERVTRILSWYENEVQRLEAAVSAAEQQTKAKPAADEMVVGSSPLHNQIMSLIAQESALEDVIDALRDHTKRGGDVTHILKLMREYAGQQFHVRDMLIRAQKQAMQQT